MKLPKTVMICGSLWNVKTHAKIAGGSFSGSDKTIHVGVKHPKDIASIFIHEAGEAIMAERCYRYRIYNEITNEKLQFVFDHAEWCIIASDLACALRGLKV